MSKYSEVIGSFLRNGSFPLEADYTFTTKEELIQFYSKPENKSILHQGLFKVVGEGNEQALYWVEKNGDDLKFTLLIKNIDIAELKKEIEALKKAHQEDVNTADEGHRLIVGTEEDDWKAYLNTLDFPSITAISKYLTELKSFLNGTNTDTLTLVDILQNLYNRIVGNVEPGTTIESLRRHLLDLIQTINQRIYNVQTELDNTQTGVGLDGNGGYNADKETYYLQDATSVMNALKTLDRLLHRYANVEYIDSDTIDFDSQIIEDETVRQITAEVKLAPDSDIIIKDGNGLYHKVSLKEDKGQITLYVNGEVRDTFNIGISPLLEDGYYDEHTEKLVLIFKLHDESSQRVEIPVSKLITEWDVSDTSSVTLNKTRVVDGVDILTADINVSEDSKNGIQIKNDGLFASKDASDLLYKEEPLETTIETIENNQAEDLAKITELQGKLNGIDLQDLTRRVGILEETVDELDWYFEED